MDGVLNDLRSHLMGLILAAALLSMAHASQSQSSMPRQGFPEMTLYIPFFSEKPGDEVGTRFFCGILGL